MKKTDSSRQAGDDSEYKNALLRAAGLCSRQEQCTSHIRDKLREWNVDDEISDKVITSLKAEHYLDDQRFAGFYVNDKFKSDFSSGVRTGGSYMCRCVSQTIDAIKLLSCNDHNKKT